MPKIVWEPPVQRRPRPALPAIAGLRGRPGEAPRYARSRSLAKQRGESHRSVLRKASPAPDRTSAAKRPRQAARATPGPPPPAAGAQVRQEAQLRCAFIEGACPERAPAPMRGEQDRHEAVGDRGREAQCSGADFEDYDHQEEEAGRDGSQGEPAIPRGAESGRPGRALCSPSGLAGGQPGPGREAAPTEGAAPPGQAARRAEPGGGGWAGCGRVVAPNEGATPPPAPSPVLAPGLTPGRPGGALATARAAPLQGATTAPQRCGQAPGKGQGGGGGRCADQSSVWDAGGHPRAPRHGGAVHGPAARCSRAARSACEDKPVGP